MDALRPVLRLLPLFEEHPHVALHAIRANRRSFAQRITAQNSRAGELPPHCAAARAARPRRIQAAGETTSTPSLRTDLQSSQPSVTGSNRIGCWQSAANASRHCVYSSDRRNDSPTPYRRQMSACSRLLNPPRLIRHPPRHEQSVRSTRWCVDQLRPPFIVSTRR
jgi:hypothetical protein